MDLREPVPACAELLHAAAGPGGAAACDLCRLADAPDRRRHHGGRAVHVPGIIAIMALSIVYAAYGKVWYVEALFFGLKAAVLAIVIEALVRVGKRALRNNIMIALGRDRLRRHLLLCRPLPDHHHRRRPDRLFRREKRTQRVCRRRPWQCEGCRYRQRARRRGAGARPARHCARAARRPVLGGAVVRSHRCDPDDTGCGQHLRPDRAVLHQDGDGDLRRRLCRARLCRAAGGRALSLAEGAGDARRPRHGRDHAGPADHGAAVRGLHGGLSRSRHAAADAGRQRSAACSRPG